MTLEYRRGRFLNMWSQNNFSNKIWSGHYKKEKLVTKQMWMSLKIMKNNTYYISISSTNSWQTHIYIYIIIYVQFLMGLTIVI